MTTRVTPHLFLVLMHYHITFLVGSMTQLIESKYPILVPMEISKELPVELSALTPKSLCFSGWKKLHRIKVETVFLPSSISTLFGPVTARQNDQGTLNLSGLDRFLTLIQAALPVHRKCMLFGDSIFSWSPTEYYNILPSYST
jgi:hypothetical protein